jgi:hypothetical protein
VVYRLRGEGYDIECEKIIVRNRYDEKCWVGRYHLNEEQR